MKTNRRRRVPKGFQQLNDLFNMGKWKWETGKNKVEPDAQIELLIEESKKFNDWFKKSRKRRMK
jgi:hypothetical protein|tara:strand:+ start:83 stop:274 length:192 start_codon:yes stop_codon:yes gene_type:complete